MPDADTPGTTVTTPEPVWGSQPSGSGPWTHTHTLAAVGIAALLAICGATVIYAATSGDNNQMEQRNPNGPRMPGGPGDDDMGTPVHSEFVVEDGQGGYVTKVEQHGTVTAVSDTSITTQSGDGFTQTYTLTPDTDTLTPDGLSVGDTAIVRATEQDGSYVATSLVEGRRQP